MSKSDPSGSGQMERLQARIVGWSPDGKPEFECGSAQGNEAGSDAFCQDESATKQTDWFPKGWTKTLNEVLAEEQHRVRAAQPLEIEWARAYERSLLRQWARFPQDGDVYEALDDMNVQYLTSWRAPFTDGGEGTIARGTRIRVSVHEDPEPIGVYAVPVDYAAVEAKLVPYGERNDPKYGGFHLTVSTDDLNRKFRLVSGAGDPSVPA